MTTNMSVVVSAPANTMLMGEHAVLFGHSALVCALTMRIYVEAHVRTDGLIVIDSKLGHFSCALADLAMHLSQPCAFSFVLQALAITAPKLGVSLVIVSDFEHTLGLGSSAAVTVATIGAMTLLTKGQFDPQDVMQQGIQVIRQVQGSGSGADVSASALGGVVQFKAKPVSAQRVQLGEQAWRHAPKLRLVYCGYKTPTPKVIAKVTLAAKKAPTFFQQCYDKMGACVDSSIAALHKGHWTKFACAMDQYQDLMRDIGVSDDAIERIIKLGRNQIKSQVNGQANKGLNDEALFGAKISGSGLGDCVLLLGSQAIDWPHQQIGVQIDPQGLREEFAIPDQTNILKETM